MSKTTINQKTLQTGTGIIWAAVLLGASFFTEADEGRMLDWELMWVIIGGFLAQSILLNAFIKNNEK